MEEHVDVEHLSSNTDGNVDEELYVVVQEDACQGDYFEEGEIMATCLVFVRFLVLMIGQMRLTDGSERQAFTVVRSETAVAWKKNHNLTHFYLFSVIVILLLGVINHKNIITITTIVIIMTRIPKWPEDSLIHHLCQKYSLTMSGSAYTRLRSE